MYAGERFNSFSHLAGLILAFVGAGLLVARSLTSGGTARTAGAIVFAVCVIALYTASTLCHSVRGAGKAFWQRMDHAAIYGLVAGTVTPFALCAPADDIWSAAGLVGVWGLALAGAWREVRATDAQAPSVGLYVAMGWLGVLVAWRGSAGLPLAGLALLLGGGLFYTLGTIFYRNRQGHQHAHGIWHLFVMGGTACHYAAIACFVV